MRSDGPQNATGPSPRERKIAQRPSVPVSEWLNKVIQSTNPDAVGDVGDRQNNRQPARANLSGLDRTARDESNTRYQGRPYRDAPRADDDAGGRGNAGDSVAREPMRTSVSLDELHVRLDELTEDLGRLARMEAQRQAPPSAALSKPVEARKQRPSADPPSRQPARAPVFSIEEAVAEITARQRALDGESAAPDVAAAPPIPAEPAVAGASEAAAEAAVEVCKPTTDDQANEPAGSVPAASTEVTGGLEDQLREITARIEALQPASDLAASVAAVRTDLAEIGRQINEALPRHAVQSLEMEVKALAERIDQSRQSGRDSNVLAGLEQGLAEVHGALRVLTPAESLVGFDEAVCALSQKLDFILAGDDPSALHQLDAAIDSLRAVVSHVASNDSVTRVAEDVRALAAQVDGIANNPATGAVLALQQRLDELGAALQASSEAGYAVPGDLEKLLAALIEKLERVQLTLTDQTALAHLEERIAALVQRFDASDAQLGHLEAIEHGLNDLLAHLEYMRGTTGPTTGAMSEDPAAAIEREVAEIKENERRTRDSLQAVQGAVEQVIDRLSTLESDLHAGVSADSAQQFETAAAPQEPPTAYRPDARDSDGLSPLAPEAPPQSAGAASTAAPRPPIDPTLPPDHPLEPGSAAGSRPSAADRIAASEAAIASVKPPVIADSGRPDFIAAARRAAQAAAWEPAQPGKNDSRADAAAQPNTLSQRLRKLLVAGAVLLLVVGGLRIATVLIGDGTSSGAPPAKSQPSRPPGASPHAARPATPPTSTPGSAPPSRSESAPPGPPAAATERKAARQSIAHPAPAQAVVGPVFPPAADQPGATAMLTWGLPDLTGGLPSAAAPGVAASLDGGTGATAGGEIELPATIGTAALRNAAMAGDPAAAYEVAIRFADGRGTAQNYEAAVYWLQRAAKAGLAPAQLRLGALYERGLGVKKDLARANDFYLAAAEQGNGEAMHNLAVLYAEGVSGAPDYKSAAAWFRKAADHGIRDSQYNLGILYARGVGVEKNDAESYKWFALAAVQGDADAAKKRDAIASRLDPQSLAAARVAVKQWSAAPQPARAVTVKMPTAWGAPAKPRVLAQQSR